MGKPLSLASFVAELLSAAPAPASGSDQFWQRFLTSAGFGGLMAVAAALIAARIAARQLRHTKAQQLQERWWDTLTWVYDRAVVEKDKRRALPHHVTFALLTQLAEHAQTPPEDRLQQGAIKSVLSMFDTSDQVQDAPQPEGSGPSVIHVSDPTAVALLDELRDKLTSDEERQRADQLLYLHEARATIETEAVALGADATVVRDARLRTIVALAWKGREILVQIRCTEGRVPNVVVLQAIERLQTEIAARYTAIGGLIIFNTPVSRAAVDAFMAAKNGPSIEVVTWTGRTDDAVVHNAIRRLRPPDDGCVSS
jgi:hypothetical protein